ncbi:MAG: hypothetical protein WDN31_06170 [Hyphomicrobium sp.]
MSDINVPQRMLKTGSERFKDGSEELAADVLSFWQPLRAMRRNRRERIG